MKQQFITIQDIKKMTNAKGLKFIKYIMPKNIIGIETLKNDNDNFYVIYQSSINPNRQIVVSLPYNHSGTMPVMYSAVEYFLLQKCYYEIDEKPRYTIDGAHVVYPDWLYFRNLAKFILFHKNRKELFEKYGIE